MTKVLRDREKTFSIEDAIYNEVIFTKKLFVIVVV